jgi:hypothetical protein
MLAFTLSEKASLVRYRPVGKDEGVCCIEALLEEPIRHLSSQTCLQNGSYIISNRGMEWMSIYTDGPGAQYNRSALGSQCAPAFPSMPYEVCLRILSCLDAKSLCRLACTCKRMNKISGDELLWKQRLSRDSHQWQMVGHLSHPAIYQVIAKGASAKIIYKQCCLNRFAPNTDDFYNPLTRVKQLWTDVSQKLTGKPEASKWIMFGSGLDKYSLDKKLFFSSPALYAISCLYPGKDGFGSGVGFTLNRESINLITLYASTWHERRAAINGHGPLVNKLVSLYNEGDPSASELTHSVRELCPSARGYVVIVDGYQEELTSEQWMLRAFLKHTVGNIPVLILSCHQGNNSPPPAVEIANKLDLQTLPNPWQVCRWICTVSIE